MPRPVVLEGQRLPATYVNFYFVNGGAAGADVRRPRAATGQALARLQAGAAAAGASSGVDCRALIWGLGAIHCLTQQQPAAG